MSHKLKLVEQPHVCIPKDHHEEARRMLLHCMKQYPEAWFVLNMEEVLRLLKMEAVK